MSPSPESASTHDGRSPHEREHALTLFPQADALLEHYKETGAGAHELEVMRDVLYSYLDRAVENMRIFRSTSGLEFPYTSVSLQDLATAVFLAHGGTRTPTVPNEHHREKTTREFLMTGYPVTSQMGGPFEFAEMPIHTLVAQLPHALEALKRGEDVADASIYTLGYPTNEFGAIPAPALEAFKQDPIDALGSAYEECIQQELERGKALGAEPEHVTLTGVSTGASAAVNTASKLVERGALSQNVDAKPHLTVTLYAPVGIRNLNEGALRVPQMTAGFAGEIAYQSLTNPDASSVVRQQSAFSEALKEKVARRMPVQMNTEHAAAKRAALIALGQALLTGAPVPSTIKVTEVIGLDDPLIYSKERKDGSLARTKQMRIERGAFGPLQGKVLPRSAPNERVFGLPMSHTLPFYRTSEFSRFDRVVEAVDALS
ncbi:MAG TPA: hypothetical protein VHC20_07605 [Candidatus Paceibacterota bacterium]|nr:hypothetical protein [Candidatus Paceibacterota bacterium]